MTRKTIHTDELIERAVSDYAHAYGLSWSAAAVELLIRGFDAWPLREWQDEQALQGEYRESLTGVAMDYDPYTDQEGGYSFARFIANRVRPQHGGRREGAGRKPKE